MEAWDNGDEVVAHDGMIKTGMLELWNIGIMARPRDISRRGAEDAETHSFLIANSKNTSSDSLFFSAFLCGSSESA